MTTSISLIKIQAMALKDEKIIEGKEHVHVCGPDFRAISNQLFTRSTCRNTEAELILYAM